MIICSGVTLPPLSLSIVPNANSFSLSSLSLSVCVFLWGNFCDVVAVTGGATYRDCSPPPLQPSQPPDQDMTL